MELDDGVVDSLGGGSCVQRARYNVTVFTGEMSRLSTDLIDRDEDRGLRGLHTQMRRTQDMVDTLPEEFADTIDETIEEQWGEIESIIESTSLDDEEKRQRVRDKLRVGLERGLPTIVYEGSSER